MILATARGSRCSREEKRRGVVVATSGNTPSVGSTLRSGVGTGPTWNCCPVDLGKTPPTGQNVHGPLLLLLLLHLLHLLHLLLLLLLILMLLLALLGPLHLDLMLLLLLILFLLLPLLLLLLLIHVPQHIELRPLPLHKLLRQ